MNKIKDLFYLNPNIIFLNNGSFGACPKPVMKVYQNWQLDLEKQPVEFLARRRVALLKESRQILAKFLNCASDEIVYLTNATTALNIIAHSLNLQAGDEILSTDLEYGAMDRMWQIICQQKSANYRRVKTIFPLKHEQFVENFFKNVNPYTKAIFMSHISSSTALLLPIKQIVDKARNFGIITVIDGAHVPGHLSFDLTDLSPDFYTGNCHKWLFAPKGAAFLYAKKSMQYLLKPFLISWGRNEFVSNSAFIDEFEYQGTRDIAPFLSVPASIKFRQQFLTQSIKTKIHQMLEYIKFEFTQIFKTDAIINQISENMQMYAHPLPVDINPQLLQTTLYDKYKIEIPINIHNNVAYIRISLQIFNELDEIHILLEVLKKRFDKP